MPGRRQQLEADDAGDDQADAEQPHYFLRFAEQHDAEHGGADSADAGPHRVGGAERQSFQRPAEQDDAGDHQGDRPDAWPWAREAIGVFEADRPADLAQSGNEQDQPGRAAIHFWLANQASAAATVAAMSASLWAADTKPASKADGAK